MKYQHIPGIETPVSRLIQGSTIINSKDDTIGFAQLDAVLESGINCIDTARVYGDKDGFLGKWMQARNNREKVIILAKGAHHSFRPRVTPFDIAADLHDTLALMQTDYVDLYILHRDDPNVPVEPIVDELNKWQKAGKIKAFGGSNWTPERLEAANAYATASNQTPFVCSSPNFALAAQLKEPWANCVTISGPQNQAARDWYAKTQMPLLTWSSLAGGFMTGRYTRETIDENEFLKNCYASEENFQRLDRAQELANKKGLTVPQIALAYVMNYPMNVHALVAPANESEIAANIAALDITLTPEEMAYLDLR
jgi:aryl-alcohol dehydrogenase-like predicted oxidoreductase